MFNGLLNIVIPQNTTSNKGGFKMVSPIPVKIRRWLMIILEINYAEIKIYRVLQMRCLSLKEYQCLPSESNALLISFDMNVCVKRFACRSLIAGRLNLKQADSLSVATF